MYQSAAPTAAFIHCLLSTDEKPPPAIGGDQCQRNGTDKLHVYIRAYTDKPHNDIALKLLSSNTESMPESVLVQCSADRSMSSDDGIDAPL